MQKKKPAPPRSRHSTPLASQKAHVFQSITAWVFPVESGWLHSANQQRRECQR